MNNHEELPAWMCIECGHVYGPSEGDAVFDIPPGRPFENLPDDWCCPVCNAGKEQFRLFTTQL
jgi:rubredoxin